MNDIIRDDKGRFPSGVSGNPSGKPAGTRNRATAIKEFIELCLSERLETEAQEVFEQALLLAKKGDKAMIKLILGDMLTGVRMGAAKSESTDKSIKITIDNMTQAPAGVTIEAEEVQ